MIKVLWFDDDFAPVNPKDDKGVQNRRKNFQDKVEDARDFNIEVEGVTELKDFKQKIETPNCHYDAVILDILGMNPNDSTDDKVLYDAYEFIKGYHHMLCYVFSNNTESHKGYLDTYFQERYFDKRNSSDLYKKINDDTNQYHSYYIGREYILDCFQKGFLDSNIKTSFMDSLMKVYASNDIDTPHGNNMRNVVERMLEKLNQIYGEKHNIQLTKKKPGDSGRPKEIAKTIVDKNDYSKLMWGPLNHMLSIQNNLSHQPIDEPFRKMYFNSDFSTFLLVCRWFYDLMVQLIGPDEVAKQTKNDITQISPKIISSIQVPTYIKNGRLKFSVEVDVPKPYYENNPQNVYVVSISTDNNDPTKWYAYLDPEKNIAK